MKRALALLAAAVASVAAGQGGPSIVPYTGDATYTYAFRLQPARGRFQPSLALMYSTGGGFGPYGVGWSLSGTYVERTGRYDYFWLVKDGERKLLVPFPANQTTTYRLEVAAAYYQLSFDAGCPG